MDIARGSPATERRKTFQLCTQQDVVIESALALAAAQEASRLLGSEWLMCECERQLATVLRGCVYLQLKIVELMVASRAQLILAHLCFCRGPDVAGFIWLITFGGICSMSLQRLGRPSAQACSSVCSRRRDGTHTKFT